MLYSRDYYKNIYNDVMIELIYNFRYYALGKDELQNYLKDKIDNQEKEIVEKHKKESEMIGKRKKYYDENKNNISDFDSCCICLTERDEINIFGITSCMHLFCNKCLIKTVESGFSCPICRTELGDEDFEFFHEGKGELYFRSEPTVIDVESSDDTEDIIENIDILTDDNYFFSENNNIEDGEIMMNRYDNYIGTLENLLELTHMNKNLLEENTKLKTDLEEKTNSFMNLNKENLELTKDKLKLTSEVSELKMKLMEKENKIIDLKYKKRDKYKKKDNTILKEIKKP